MNTVHTLVLVLGLSFFEGITLQPCGNNGIYDVTWGQTTKFTCRANGPVQWRVQFGDSQDSDLLVSCQQSIGRCYVSTEVGGLFLLRMVDGQRMMVVNAVNNTKIWESVQLVNGSLSCNEMSGSMLDCYQLNFVYLPKNVSCRAVTTSGSLTVSCVIGRVYSSRRLYTCQLLRFTNGSMTDILDSAPMMTTPTTDLITESEVKVSGFCQFNSTLPTQEGRYTFSVSISPGGGVHNARFTDGRDWYSIERPSPPTLSCQPLPCVLGQLHMKCRCTAQHPGQPIGLLQLLMGNQTYNRMLSSSGEPENDNRNELFYRVALREEDYNETWFRCDSVWRTETISGQNHIFNVAWAFISKYGRTQQQDPYKQLVQRIQIINLYDRKPPTADKKYVAPKRNKIAVSNNNHLL